MSKIKVMVISPEVLMGALCIAADILANVGRCPELAKAIPKDSDMVLEALMAAASTMEDRTTPEAAKKAMMDALMKAAEK